MEAKPDLYGWVWIPTTVVFLVFATSNLAASIYAYLQHQSHQPDFEHLSRAAYLIYPYVLGVPLLLWGASKWYLKLNGFGLIPLMCLYGYSLSIFIPITVSFEMNSLNSSTLDSCSVCYRVRF